MGNELKSEAARTGIPTASELTPQQETEKGKFMSTVTPHPVDSTTRTCCGGIGGHARDCWRIRDKRRRITNSLAAYPASDWTLDEAQRVLDVLSDFVRERQAATNAEYSRG